MAGEKQDRKISWYRSPVERNTLAELNQRSDGMGMLQTAGYLGLLALTGASAVFAAGRLPWPLVLLVLYVHGTFWAFLLNAFHEFCHRSVFKTQLLNAFFLQVVSFLSWNNPILFWASHQEHHKYTLHPPDDLEVVLPTKLTLPAFIRIAVVSPWDFYYVLRGAVRLSLGKVDGEWMNALFPASAPERRRKLFTWTRLMLLGHLAIAAVSIYFGLWMIPVVVSLARFYGGGLQYLCNNTQHTGLQDKVGDYRLCTRTILLPGFIQFLYWHMNFHIEHHMYAAVPCYKLSKLHELIKDDLPPSLGLIDAWKQIIEILKKQETDPGYQYAAPLPARQAA